MMKRPALGVLALLVGSVSAIHASDWPQFRGPERNGISAETGLLKSWPEGGPKLLWKAENLGEGHATPSVAKGRIYGLGLRGADEVVWCLEAKTGKEIWSKKIADGVTLGANQGGYGSRGTPTVVDKLLYAEGVSGAFVCMDVSNGNIKWQKNFQMDFGGRLPIWGFSESPLVDGDRVIATPGGKDATIVCFNRMTGDIIWKSVIEGGRAAYSSAIQATVDGRKIYIQFLSGGVVGVDAKSGEFLWQYSSPANRQGISCSMPIYKDNMVFAATAYQTGGGLARLTSAGGKMKADEVYFTKQMQNHHGGMVLVGDYLYGFDQSNLTCLEFKTGKLMWADRSVGKGSVTVADGMLYARSESGPIGLVELNPQKYSLIARFDQPERSKAPAWPYPVVSNGQLLIRDQNMMLCYNVAKK